MSLPNNNSYPSLKKKEDKNIIKNIKESLILTDDQVEEKLDTIKNFVQKYFKISVSDFEKKVKLRRKKEGRVFGGVCTGISAHLNINPWFLRTLFIVGNFLPGPGIMAYLFLWIILPYEREN